MLHGEMGRVHVAEPNPAPEGQALHGSVGDGAAKAGVLQQLPGLEALPAFQPHSLSHFADGDKDALLHFAAGAHEPQARPHCMVWGALVPAVSGPAYSTSSASSGARLRSSRSLICSRLAWEMTRQTSGSPLHVSGLPR